MIDTNSAVSDAELAAALNSSGVRGVADLAATAYIAMQAAERVVSVVQVMPGEFVRTMADGTSYHGAYDGFATGGPRIRWTKMANVVITPESP